MQTVEKLRSAQEKSELAALKKATSELKKEDMYAFKMRHEAIAKKQMAAEKKFQEQLQQTMKDLSTPENQPENSKGDHVRSMIKDPPQHTMHHDTNPTSVDQDYSTTYQAAEKVEEARRQAFLKEVQQLKTRDEDEVIKRAKLLQQESERDVQKRANLKAREAAKARLAKKMLAIESGETKPHVNLEKTKQSKDEERIKSKSFAGRPNRSKKPSQNSKSRQENTLHELDLSSDKYHASVKSMWNADIVRSREERIRRLAYHKEREQLLSKDKAEEQGVADVLDKTSASLLEPNQLSDAAPSHNGDKQGNELFHNRESEAQMIIDDTNS